jgi:hypothetical protein
VGRIAGATLMDGNKLMLFNPNLMFYLYDVDKMELDTSFTLAYKRGETTGDYASANIYTNQYNDMVCRSFEENILFNVVTDHPDYFIIGNPAGFLNESRHIREINTKQPDKQRFLAAGYPASYRENPSQHVIFNGTCFDVDKEGRFWVNYDTDSLIYVYDRAYHPLATFGYQGKGMNTDYLSIHSPKESQKNYRKERDSKGWYYWIEYVDETGVLFRSYRKDQWRDGLQIYEGNTLKEDIEVPKGLRVMGYVAPYYYSYVVPVMEEEDNSLLLYRFKYK